MAGSVARTRQDSVAFIWRYGRKLMRFHDSVYILSHTTARSSSRKPRANICHCIPPSAYICAQVIALYFNGLARWWRVPAQGEPPGCEELGGLSVSQRHEPVEASQLSIN